MRCRCPEVLTSNVFGKIEAGIPARGLWPVDILSFDVLSWVCRLCLCIANR